MPSNKYKRKVLRDRAPVERKSFRLRTERDVLPDLTPSLGRLPGYRRCGVLGLEASDCQQLKLSNSVYCYYHDKLRRGLTQPTGEVYPVWPLPVQGYILVTESN